MSRFSFLKSPSQWVRGCFAFGVTFYSFSVLAAHVHLVVNKTDSLPIKTFIHLKHQPPKKGDYTLVSSAWYNGRLIKQVLAEAGEKITYDSQGALYVGSKKIGVPKTKTKEGKPLTPIAPQVIPEGYVFLYAPHNESFDSRYVELGLVKKSALQGCALPVV